ncbi:MAG: amidohydrolase [Gammaproteobacteria bacterium]|nr:amidohydrolase [Gammaproteobacteria bacterium]
MHSQWQPLIADAIDFRHLLHRHPELSWQEHETARRIGEALDAANITWRRCADTGIIATLNRNASGEHIALRADTDALPIEERGRQGWRSQHSGVMHACGHDGHSATLLAVGRWLKQHESALPGPVTLIFQPAEEGGNGAESMIAGGALEGVDAIFGWHNWPAIPFTQAACPDGTIMAANSTFYIEVIGKGGHASQPEACHDPLLAGAAITLALQQIVSRRLPPQQAAVVSVCTFDDGSQGSGSANVIREKVKLAGTIRVTAANYLANVESLVTTIAADTARSYGVTATTSHHPSYPATINHRDAAARVREIFTQEWGGEWQSSQPLPIMGAEDFSFYLQKCPGAYALIGNGNGERPCHSPHYDFNDKLIEPVTRILCRLANLPPSLLPAP